MKIQVSQITPEGLYFKLNSESPWIVQVIDEAFPVENPDKRSITGEVSLLRFGEHVRMDGKLKVDLHVSCDRCLEAFVYPIEVNLAMNLTPVPKTEGRQMNVAHEEKELEVGDLEYSVYENDEFDLGDLVREQCVLSLPTKMICAESCKGLCARCGINLNKESCLCNQVPLEGSPWAVLKNFSKGKA